jgi:hypothetical protein
VLTRSWTNRNPPGAGVRQPLGDVDITRVYLTMSKA